MHGSGGMADDEPMAEMNLIPLIDIALTLVIILMVTTTFIKKPGVALQLPHTVTREGTPEKPKELAIAVDAQGRMFVDGNQLDAPQLQARLNATAALNPDARVLIKGDRSAVFGSIMTVTDMVRQARLTKIVFPTLPVSPGASTPESNNLAPTGQPSADASSPPAGNEAAGVLPDTTSAGQNAPAPTGTAPATTPTAPASGANPQDR